MKINLVAKSSNGHTALYYDCLSKCSNNIEIIQFLMKNGFTLEKAHEPKKTNPDINKLHHGATLLDLFYDRTQLYHHYLDIQYLRHL
ncbi:unnamed protein product [Rotaria sordida]|uniref:Ankyrin repeat protein n=1 Tax=Rotaria sordida TaxID=392033 RepID=A0A819JM51_9BILA|nr:unnamed protein product [Rotaria sordida]CAF1266542.1 unnamed protein product [Rotaria sordida]CAF3825820.1 unnamed protein product [Rotaria sordida]CAF3935223.1 unnamed protein product [Rotaria sordida]